MKVSLNPMSFKADLLIDNRAQKQEVYELSERLKYDFSSTTPNDDESLIMITDGNDSNDSFKLVDKDGERTALYKAPFSKFIGKVPYKQVLTRLKNIYELLTIKADYNRIIDSYKTYRDMQIARINAIKADPELSEFQKSTRLSSLNRVVKNCNIMIDKNMRLSKIDCDSFELSSGLKSELE